MKMNRVLSRCYLAGYIVWLFGNLLFPFLLARVSGVMTTVFVIISFLILAGMIVSHVFYSKLPKLFPLFSAIFEGANFAFIICAFITELIYIGMGELGLYAIIILSIAMAIEIPASIYLVREIYRFRKKQKAKELSSREAAI